MLGAEMGLDAARRFFTFAFLNVFFQAIGLQSRRRFEVAARSPRRAHPLTQRLSPDLRLRRQLLEVSVDELFDVSLGLGLERCQMRRRLLEFSVRCSASATLNSRGVGVCGRRVKLLKLAQDVDSRLVELQE